MCLNAKEFDMLTLKLNNLKEILETEKETKLTRTSLDFTIWLDNSKLSNEDCLYDMVCWNYKYCVDGKLILDSSEQADTYFYDNQFLKDGTIDYSIVEHLKDSFMSLINDAIEVEQYLKNIDNLSDYYESYEVAIDPKNEEFYLADSLPYLIAQFSFNNHINITDQLHMIHLDTFKSIS
ncbi:hypothetical protein [Vagococcus fluvialis]|uniref:hypothetical protein n=1 Tax=Vagococcus fluvialis TaxID=2738 RepID=UPI003B5BC780